MSQVLKHKRPLLLPYWVVNVLERQGLPLSTVVDLCALKSALSAEDLAQMLLLNTEPSLVFGSTSVTSGLWSYWGSNADSAALLRSLREIVPLHAQGLQDRLFGDATYDECYPKEFSIRDLDDATFLVIIYPGHFGGKEATINQFKLIRSYLKQWYGYSNMDTVARDPLFQSYLEQL